MSDIQGDFETCEPGEQFERVAEIVSAYGLTKSRDSNRPHGLFTTNDPFDRGTEGDWEKARWLRGLYDLAGGESYTGHLRDMHYLVNALRPDLYDASPESWEKLMDAKKLAVSLGLLSPDALDDRSISSHYNVEREAPVPPRPMGFIFAPETEDLGEFQVAPYPPAALLPFDLLLWVEKPSPAIEGEVIPVCRRYGMDARFGRGTPGQTFVGHLAARAAAEERELVILVLSDADNSGGTMARSLAKNAEIIVRAGLIEDTPRIRVVRCDFTMTKVAEIEERIGRTIPRTEDAKTKEKRVELQALPAFVPGELGRIVEDAALSVVGHGFKDAASAWEADLDAELAESDEATVIEDLHAEYADYLATDEARAVIEQIEEFERRRSEATDDLHRIIEDAEPLALDEPGTDWLLDTDRSFMEQMQAYNRHEGAEPIVLVLRACEGCGEPLTGRPQQKFCSPRCRMAVTRSRKSARHRDENPNTTDPKTTKTTRPGIDPKGGA